MQASCDSLPVVDPGPVVDAFLTQGCRGVTIDVFDTLLWRETLYPSDAFLLLAEAHGHYHYSLRIWAEKLASRFCRHLLGREPNLKDIYLAYPLSPRYELAIESRLCQANPFCLALIQKLLERRVPVAAISDMYLDNGQIAGLLAESGFPEIPVFSSASVDLTKYRDGSLFHHVWQHLGLTPQQVVHVGDNPEADIAMARSLGAQVCHLAAPRDSLARLLSRPLPAINSTEESLGWGRLAIRLHCQLGNGTSSPQELASQLRDPAFPAEPHAIRKWLQSHRPSQVTTAK